MDTRPHASLIAPMTRPDPRRRLGLIVLGSVGMHALLLSAVQLSPSGDVSTTAANPPLEIHLRLIAADPGTTSMPHAAATSARTPPPGSATSRATAPMTAPQASVAARSTLPHEATSPAAAGTPSSAATTTTTTVPAQPATPPAAATASTANGPSSQQDDALGSYRQQLSSLFAQRHSYPRVAAMRGWEGEVRLRLTISRQGGVLAVGVEKSSGYSVLDQDAVTLLETHPGLPPLPSVLNLSEVQIILPIHYKLRKIT